jgi:CRISPR/Cas system CMR subunit Cmr4 (Cas7 group RAMP superfamily)
MYTVIHWGDSKNTAEDKLKADTIKRFITEEVIKNHIQTAGDETCGRGIFELTWK